MPAILIRLRNCVALGSLGAAPAGAKGCPGSGYPWRPNAPALHAALYAAPRRPSLRGPRHLRDVYASAPPPRQRSRASAHLSRISASLVLPSTMSAWSALPASRRARRFPASRRGRRFRRFPASRRSWRQPGDAPVLAHHPPAAALPVHAVMVRAQECHIFRVRFSAFRKFLQVVNLAFTRRTPTSRPGAPCRFGFQHSALF